MRSCVAVAVVACALAAASGCPRAPDPPPPNEPTIVVAQPASGDFDWSIDEAKHPLRSGAAFLGPGGALEIVLADAEVTTPCDAAKLASDPQQGPERVRAHVPRGLDVDWPIGREISPGALQLHPLDKSKMNAGGRLVPRYELRLDAIDFAPGGRVKGRLAWVGQPKDAAHGIDVGTLGEGTFDVPLCATKSELDAFSAVHPTPIDPGADPVRGSTTNGKFAAQRAFAVLRSWYGLPPHPPTLELYTDPLVDCGTRVASKGTMLRVALDAGTALGRHNGTRQPVGAVECGAGATTWDCMGEATTTRGFVQIDESDLRIGGHVRGTLAIAGPNGALLEGTFDAQLCAPD